MFAIEGDVALDKLKEILRYGIGNIPNLSPAVEEYFEKDFKSGKGQAGQIISRLNGLVANPVFEALFAAKHSTVDIGEEMQNGRLIVIRVNERALGGEKSAELYGRFWIEQVAKTVYPRLSLPKHERKPVLFIIDEAQLYIKEDRRLAAILDTAAEARIGMLLAVHHMSQIEDARVRDSMYTNCMLKFSARTSADIHNLGRSMGDSDVAVDMINKVKRFEFAYHGPDMEKAIKVKFPLVEFGAMPRMSDEEYQELREMSRERYGYVAEKQPTPSKPELPPEPEEEDVGFGKL